MDAAQDMRGVGEGREEDEGGENFWQLFPFKHFPTEWCAYDQDNTWFIHFYNRAHRNMKPAHQQNTNFNIDMSYSIKNIFFKSINFAFVLFREKLNLT